MSSDQSRLDHVIIHTGYAIAGAIGALAPIPGSDAVLIMPIQVAMTVSLAAARGKSVSGSMLASAGVATVGQIIGKGGSRLMTRWIPGAGNFVRAGVAISVTEGLGWALVAEHDRS